jgi:hypothetical protein
MNGVGMQPAAPLTSWGRARYRAGQFLSAMRASVQPEEVALVRALLPGKALLLFEAMPVDAQRHSLNVLYSLRAAGFSEVDLAVAALLHDVGKAAAWAGGVRLGPWLRGPLVVGEWLAPGLMRRLAVDDPARGWRYALYVQLEHAAIGAKWAAQAGCSRPACWLIAHHQDVIDNRPGAAPEEPARLRLLAALQWADSKN